MKETPFIHLGLRVERSTYYEFIKVVKSANTTASQYLRDLLNRDLNLKITYESSKMESAQNNESSTNNSIK